MSIEIEEEFPVVNYDYCKGCGICAEECPTKCIAMVEERK
jgi:pyruvate ferredoxin oxidoreductase delta subunit